MKIPVFALPCLFVLAPLTAQCAPVSVPASSAANDVIRQRSWVPDNGNGTFTNPLMWGDWPDPDVIRVGDDFYLTSTSMHFVPGCPIAKSQDLVNWEMAGYAVERYEEDPRWDMKGGELYLNGSWATTLRYHDGLFYLGFCTPSGWGTPKGHFSMCVAKDIGGPWKRTIFPEYLYDPGLFFDDDGKAYVVHGQGTLYLTELAPDALSVAKPPLKIWSGGFNAQGELAQSNAPFGLEGSHVYKVDGRYYILCAGGGTEGFQICLRSDKIEGPYEWKLVCKDASSYPPNGLHQGGMVQLKDGTWWFVIMQDRGPIGRVPHLVPVRWVDGWPMLESTGDGQDKDSFSKPFRSGHTKLKSPATSDEFASASLGLQWQWNHNPDPTNWSLTRRRGYLRLTSLQASALNHARNQLTQRVQGPASEATVKLDYHGLKVGDISGLSIFQSPFAFIAVHRDVTGDEIVYVDNDTIIERKPLPASKQVWFQALATSHEAKATFSYSLDGKRYISVGKSFTMGLGYPWTANRFGLFNYSTDATGVGGIADFDWFRLRMVTP